MLSTLLVGMMLPIGQAPIPPQQATPSALQLLAPNGIANQSQTALLPGMNDNPPATTPPPTAPTVPAAPADKAKSNGDSESKEKDKDKEKEKAPEEPAGFAKRFFRGYPAMREWFPNWLGKPEEKKEDESESAPEPFRRALPAPLKSPPFPGGEWQGYPLVGLPPADDVYPLMNAIYGGPYGDAIKESRIKAYGWFNASGNWSTSKNSNTPDSYWIVPNSVQLDQIVFRLERLADTAQQDHIDVGFRSTLLYGIDYRYMTAGGWFSQQLLKYNNLYGADPTEQYIDVYIPGVSQGLIIRVGRWIACPDIETQFAPDNYMGTHSILFTFDTYTQTGVMATVMLNKQWTVQAAIHAGTDMAPWYQGAIPTGMFGIRWVASDNRDSVYVVLNAINDAEFRHFTEGGVPSGHDNFNYLVWTWQHLISDRIHTKTESYIMWQRDAFVGGTPSLGPVEPFGGGGGLGAPLPGLSLTYGTVNYTMFSLSKKTFVTVRNEWWRDERGERSGFPGTYTSHAIGLSYNLSSNLQLRPEIGYYRNWDIPAFDLGTKQGMFMGGMDVTLRY
jgi:hypothetical protein